MAAKKKQYRQVTLRLRIQRGAGHPDFVSERPRRRIAAEQYEYTDIESPTLVSFDRHCQVDVEQLLRIGAIEQYEAPAAKTEPAKATDATAADAKSPAASGS